MSKLIALVATAVMVNGERTVIQPGQPLPDMSKHDERELLASGAAENPADTDALAKANAKEVAAGAKEFEDARQRSLQAQASTATDTKPAATTAAKPAAKK